MDFFSRIHSTYEARKELLRKSFREVLSSSELETCFADPLDAATIFKHKGLFNDPSAESAYEALLLLAAETDYHTRARKVELDVEDVDTALCRFEEASGGKMTRLSSSSFYAAVPSDITLPMYRLGDIFTEDQLPFYLPKESTLLGKSILKKKTLTAEDRLVLQSISIPKSELAKLTVSLGSFLACYSSSQIFVTLCPRCIEGFETFDSPIVSHFELRGLTLAEAITDMSDNNLPESQLAILTFVYSIVYQQNQMTGE